MPLEKVARIGFGAAQKLTTADYFNCFSCHQQGDKKPEGPPDGWAPDLAMARKRLNPDWIIRWLHNPQAVQPGTKMPSFYEKGGAGRRYSLGFKGRHIDPGHEEGRESVPGCPGKWKKLGCFQTICSKNQAGWSLSHAGA